MKKNRNRKKQLILSWLLIISFLCFATFQLSADDCVQFPYPAGKLGHSMIYDSVNDVIIVYGGATGEYDLDRKYDTRAYDYSINNWTNLKPTLNPYPSSWGAMAYDSESEKIIQFGGIPQNDYASNETWIYDYTTNTWTKADPNDVPSMRSSNVMAYDSESDVVIMHGGAIDAEYNPDGVLIHYNDTWAYDYNSDTWTEMSPTGLIVGLAEAQMTYDSESDRCIMFGGYYESPYYDFLEESYAFETWAYDYNTNNWENITTTVHPDYRMDHSLAYDLESDRTILVGGHNVPGNTDLLNDTWAFDYNTATWEDMNPSYGPKRLAHQTAYDEVNDLVILFGGVSAVGAPEFSNKIYTYDYNTNTWTLMPSVLCPDPTPTDEGYWSFAPMILTIGIVFAAVIIRRKSK